MEHENEFLHSEAGGHYIRYNDARNEEIARRHNEIWSNVSRTYFSKSGIVILVISIILSIITAPTEILGGIIVWNILIFILVFGFFSLFAKTQVRPEINREQAVHLSAREKAYRR
jgi:hypothetical protein